MSGQTEVIAALCRIIEQCAALIEDEQTRNAMLAEMRRCMGEVSESDTQEE